MLSRRQFRPGDVVVSEERGEPSADIAESSGEEN